MEINLSLKIIMEINRIPRWRFRFLNLNLEGLKFWSLSKLVKKNYFSPDTSDKIWRLAEQYHGTIFQLWHWFWVIPNIGNKIPKEIWPMASEFFCQTCPGHPHHWQHSVKPFQGIPFDPNHQLIAILQRNLRILFWPIRS